MIPNPKSITGVQTKPTTSIAQQVVESRYPTTLGGNLWNAFQMTNVGMSTVGPPEWAKDRRAQLDANRAQEAKAIKARADLLTDQATVSGFEARQAGILDSKWDARQKLIDEQNAREVKQNEAEHANLIAKYAFDKKVLTDAEKNLPQVTANNAEKIAQEKRDLAEKKKNLDLLYKTKTLELENKAAAATARTAEIARAAFTGGTQSLIDEQNRAFTMKGIVVNRLAESQEALFTQFNDIAALNPGMSSIGMGDYNTLMNDPNVMRLNSLTAIARRHGEITAADPSLVGDPKRILEDDIIKALMEYEGLHWVPDANGSTRKGTIFDTVGGIDPKTGKHIDEEIEVYAGLFKDMQTTISLENREILDRFGKAAMHLKDPKGYLFRTMADKLVEFGVGRLQGLEMMAALVIPGARYRAAIDSPVPRNERGEALPVEGERVELIDQQKLLAASVLSFALTLEPGSEKLEEVLVGLEQFKTLLGVDVLNEEEFRQGTIPFEDLMILDPTTKSEGLKVTEWLNEFQRTSPLFIYMQGLAGEHLNAYEVKQNEQHRKSITLTPGRTKIGGEYQAQTELGEMVLIPMGDLASMALNVFQAKPYVPTDMTVGYTNFIKARGLPVGADSYGMYLTTIPPHWKNTTQEQVSAYIKGLNLPVGQGAFNLAWGPNIPAAQGAAPNIPAAQGAGPTPLGHAPKTPKQNTWNGWELLPLPESQQGTGTGAGAAGLVNTGQPPSSVAAALLPGKVNVANASNPAAATAAVQGQTPLAAPEPDWAEEGWAYTPTEAQVNERSTLLAELLAIKGEYKIPSELVQEFDDTYKNDPVKGKEFHHTLKWTNFADKPKAETDRNWFQKGWFATGRGIGAGYAHVVQQLKVLGDEIERGEGVEGSYGGWQQDWSVEEPNIGQQPIGKSRPSAGEPNFINEGFINLFFPEIDWSPIPKGTAEKVVKNNPEFAKLARELHIKKFPKGNAKSIPADDHQWVEWAFRQQVAFNVQGKKYQDLLTQLEADDTTKKLFKAWSAQYDKAMEDSKETDQVGGVGKYVLTQRPKTKAATAAANERARLVDLNVKEEAARLKKQRAQNQNK